MRYTAASRADYRGALQTKRPHGACWVEVKHVEHIAEVEPRRLHSELHMTIVERGKVLEILRLDDEIVDRAGTL